MIKILLAKNSGFCFGVKRAIKMAEDASVVNEKVNTWGPIIHNPQMVSSLQEKGVVEINDLSEVSDAPVVIRSHGIPLNEKNSLSQKGMELIDATCPYVSKAFDYASLADNEKYTIFILGNPEHPEIIALKSYIKNEYHIVQSNFSAFEKSRFGKCAIICQTTQNEQNLEKLILFLTKRCNELRVFNTICNATNVRQDSTIELAKEANLMVVIGGKNSSNTKMLATLCTQFAPTYHIETANELDKNWFDSANTIGLTAGASTPDWIILDVYNKINKIVGNLDIFATNVHDIPGYKEEINEC
ncbi:MAG: 4-hydroxy-3-methylbut-2-enyl diphosphate reductase [Candidatus Cloacimonadales bacterium]|jgi:4-hydroxy-3-methylbut-2-enyl diphosphate reductase|nr:4-hydroxy-3-methylbut-2-enyl diphosphate reductase [Candidatus Cloacimonadota bacterium]MDD2650054.1 4-hydroxy-3-methylbut-2-enyl diphosphate reductase [Candidatus Cloacimonadota bacterium]MDD3501343.1 4-hydroxy-3-methylbut-2-enyl diphosphate reductase [Candidatus Cloacimonadota bacterium]MDX9976787.1 4-hydroxy-3-methylbut-2-enyl diphosphate reductase [Candidatus Cloacimonadales bacterium]